MQAIKEANLSPLGKKISVIIRTYNSAVFIRDAIDSVLNQTLSEDLYQIIAIDDGSTDNTKQILKSYGIKVKVEETGGQGYIEAANLGIRKSEGKYVILLDSDDTLEPAALEKLLNAIEECNADFAYCDYYENSVDDGETRTVSLKKSIFNSVAGGILFRKSVLEEVGGYDEDLVFPEYDLLIKLMRKKCRHAYVPLPLFTYYRRKGSVTADKEKVQKGLRQLYDKYGELEGLRKY